jgi:hypothetical protein
MTYDQYEQILNRTGQLREEMLDAYSRNDWPRSLELSKEIGREYFPDKTVEAGRIAYLVESIAREFYFRGVLDKTKRVFEPPF